MMVRFYLFAVTLICLTTNLNAQHFWGLRASQYGGVTNVGFNPAIAGNRHRFDMNLFGFSGNAENNYIGIDRNVLFRKNYINNNLNFQDAYLKERLNGKDKFGYAHLQYQGPLSFMFTFGKYKEEHKNALAFTWNVNSVVNINYLSQKLARISYWGVGFKADSLEKFDYTRLNEKDFTAQVLSWADYGITYSREIMNTGNHYLKAGGTIKLVLGLVSVNAGLSNLQYRFQNYDTISIYDTKGYLDVSQFVPTARDYNENNSSANPAAYVRNLFKPGNGGISAAGDLAVVYEWRPKRDRYQYEMDNRSWYDVGKSLYTLQAGFSMTDLGRIRFKRSEYSYEFNINREDWYVKDFEPNDGLQSISDTILITEGFVIAENSSSKPYYGTWLPARFNFWADYNPVHFFGVHAMASVAPRMNRERSVHHVTTFTVTPHIDWKCMGLYLPLSHSVRGNTNLGATLRIGPLIVGTQDLLGLIGAKKFMYNADVHVALKIPILARKHSDRDRDKVSRKYDECRKEKGNWESKGCPDRDGDGITDVNDYCPDVPGPREKQGCPDRDDDGVYDMEDECPDTPGLQTLKGCPDRDGDGIADKNDECPDEPGEKAFNGCPDRDKDGVADKADDCPDVPGDIDHRGCPDTDKDGLYDNEDKCPLVPGPLENKGCPYADSDGDGVPDKDDECPKTPGLPENKGCPVVEKKELEILKYAFDNLEFETGKDIIKPGSYPSLNALALLLSGKSDYNLQIDGHTDNVGDDDKNMDLSIRRAEAVKRYLVNKGINAGRLQTAGYGETRPIADNATPAGRQKNRRVEMKILFR